MLILMAENMPRTTAAFINWSRTHAQQWLIAPDSIGISVQQAKQFDALAEELAAANLAAEEARLASIDATLRLHTAMAATRVKGGSLIGLIKNFAAATRNPNVYAGSGVSAARPQGTLPPPLPPYEFRSAINSDGSLVLMWKARQPMGVTDVVYIVHRRLDSESDFAVVGFEGKNKSFTDRELPLGVKKVEYMIRPKRGEQWGESSVVHSVQFGTLAERERAVMRKAA